MTKRAFLGGSGASMPLNRKPAGKLEGTTPFNSKNNLADRFGMGSTAVESIVGVHSHHALKAGFEAGFLAVDVADQALHGGKLLGVTSKHRLHAGL